MKYTIYSPDDASNFDEDKIIDFLFTHLEQYGDEREAIKLCMDYAMARNNKPGGIVITAEDDEKLLGATILNETGMEGYIPENILVYIAVHGDARGKGVGKSIMKIAKEAVQGDIALHVEPENPARHLYEKEGFVSKYVEMRFHR